MSWIRIPLTFRTDSPINAAQISVAGGTSATSTNAASQTEYGVYTSTATLVSNTTDAANYASWLTTYYTGGRVRCPVLTIDLVQRPDADRAVVLARQIGDRITITQVPPGFPVEAQNLVIEGIHHTSGVLERLVVWTTSPMIGATNGASGPWFRLGSSALGGSDGPNLIADAFGRVGSNGWHRSDTGQVWSPTGDASALSTDGTIGAVSLAAYGVGYGAVIGSQTDTDIRFGKIFNVPAAVPLGGNIYLDVVGRYLAPDTFIGLELQYAPTNVVTATLFTRVAGATTVHGSMTVAGLATTGSGAVHMQMMGSTVRAKAWISGTPEPSTWALSGTTTLTGAGAVGALIGSDATLTNPLPYVWAVGSFTASPIPALPF